MFIASQTHTRHVITRTMEMTQHQRSRITATTTQRGARGVTQSLKASDTSTSSASAAAALCGACLPAPASRRRSSCAHQSAHDAVGCLTCVSTGITPRAGQHRRPPDDTSHPATTSTAHTHTHTHTQPTTQHPTTSTRWWGFGKLVKSKNKNGKLVRT